MLVRPDHRDSFRRSTRVALAAMAVVSLCQCSAATGSDGGDVAPESAPDVATSDVVTMPMDTPTPGDVPTVVDAPSVDVVSDAPRTDVIRADVILPDVITGGPTYTFVASRLTIDATDAPEVAHTGFNVDGLFSGPTDADGCNHEDFFSLFDRDQHSPSGCAMGATPCTGGVDNQLPTVIGALEAVAGSDPRMILAGEVTNNRFAVLVQLSSVDDPVNDSSIGIRVFIGYPTFTTGCTSVAADREYSVSAASLRPGGTGPSDALIAVPGAIVGGRVITTTPVAGGLPFPLPIGAGLTLDVSLHALQVRFDLASTLDRGTNGNLGGWAPGNELVDAIDRIAPGFREAVEAILAGVVDVRLPGMTTCVDRTTPTMPQFGGASMGLGAQLVRARVSTTTPVAARPAVGTCGAM